MRNHNILFFSDSVSGGVGRVISVLTEDYMKRNCRCQVLCLYEDTSNGNAEVLQPKPASHGSLSLFSKIHRFGLHIAYSFVGRVHSIFHFVNADYSLIWKYYYKNYSRVTALKKYISEQGFDTVIAFLNEPIFLSLLASGKRIGLITSERNDPAKFEGTETTMAFIRKMYPKADCMVFQSPDAMQWYKNHTNVNGRVIFNPVKPDLPVRYIGKRQKKIVNFCRISNQKNLHLLVNAFTLFLREFPDYELYIFGDSVGNGAEGYLESVMETVQSLNLEDKVFVFPAQKDIHRMVADYAMFVSSSDYEGMSNSMLEAMAIGLPTICTDCPAGGARAVIKDHENGILVPVGDAQAMADAMKEVASDFDLAEKLSENGVKIRDDLSVDKIVNQWMEIIDG